MSNELMEAFDEICLDDSNSILGDVDIEQLITLDDVAQDDNIYLDEIEELEDKLSMEKRLGVIKSSPYFTSCKECGKSWLPMSETFVSKCPFCK